MESHIVSLFIINKLNIYFMKGKIGYRLGGDQQEIGHPHNGEFSLATDHLIYF
jgi:hypothetical protein